MTTPLTILFTSVGRRVSLLQSFRDTCKAMGIPCRILAIDLNPSLSAACQIADEAIQVPRVDAPNYIDVLSEIIQTHNVNIVIPTIDPELHVLAHHEPTLNPSGTTWIMVPPEAFCHMCNSKLDSADWFISRGLNTPTTLDSPPDTGYPVFAKLDNSSSSIGATIVHNKEDANRLKEENERYVFQNLLIGDEFTVDMYISTQQQLIAAVPRQRLEVRAGEVSKGITVKNPVVMDAIQHLANALDSVHGVLTVQLMLHNGQPSFIEINPRFGGGYPLSYHAGANFAEFIINDYLNQPLQPHPHWDENKLMLRYDAEVICSPS